MPKLLFLIQIITLFMDCLAHNEKASNVKGSLAEVTQFEIDHLSHYRTDQDSFVDWPELKQKNLIQFCQKYIKLIHPKIYKYFTASEPDTHLLHYLNLRDYNFKPFKPVLVKTVLCLRPNTDKHFSDRCQYFITRTNKKNCVYLLDRIKPKASEFHIAIEHCDFDNSDDADEAPKSKAIEASELIKIDCVRSGNDAKIGGGTSLIADISKHRRDGNETSGTANSAALKSETRKKPASNLSSLDVGDKRTIIPFFNHKLNDSLFSFDSPIIPMTVDPESGLFVHVFNEPGTGTSGNGKTTPDNETNETVNKEEAIMINSLVTNDNDTNESKEEKKTMISDSQSMDMETGFNGLYDIIDIDNDQ